MQNDYLFVAVSQQSIALLRYAGGVKFESNTFKLFIGGSIASIACNMQEVLKMNFMIGASCALAVFCFGYYAFAASYAGVHSSFLWFWLLAGIGLICIGGLFLLHKRVHLLDMIPKFVKMTIGLMIGIGVVIFLAMEVMIVSKMNARPERGADYVVVLGAQVRGTRITKSLAKRLDAAYDYLLADETAKVVCTGGQGRGEEISEAQAMSDYLVGKGIDKSRIIMENQSTSTYENLEYSLALIGDDKAEIVIVTNNFHVYRAVHLAKYVGFTKVSGMAADSDNRLLLNYMVREGLALLKELVVH